MTAPDPARLHQSIRQLEGDGGRVDVEQLRGLLERATPGPWFAYDRGVGYEIALDEPGDTYPRTLPEGLKTSLGRAEDAELIAAAVNALPALLDLIRRQDAALTAVQELADALDIDAASEAMEAESDELDPHQMERQMGRSEATQSAADALRAALASPDTTQDGGS